ncbi:MAG TPA: GNAT family N-acetyltransferase [Chitinophagales bacterium]|nr:GNAT family N-acetyltransferase [Chitinophagales bacterium]
MEIKPYQPGDETSILGLFEKAFNRKMTPSFWQWRYNDNPFCDHKMIYSMYDGDLMVGHYAVSPVYMKINGQQVLNALSMTTMTHPNYNGKGIFTTLAGKLYADIHNQFGVEAVYGFPNLNSHYGLVQKLAWHNVSAVPVLQLSTLRLAEIKKEDYRIAKTFTQQHSNVLTNYYDAPFGTNRSLKYLEWRYIKNPDNHYYIIELADSAELSFVVIKIFNSLIETGKKEMDILELGFAPNSDLIRKILGAIAKFIQDENIAVTNINTWLPLFDKRHLALEKNKFAFALPVTILGAKLLSDRVSVMADYRNWNLSMGDSDIF